jgi:hypothetical protein
MLRLPPEIRDCGGDGIAGAAGRTAEGALHNVAVLEAIDLGDQADGGVIAHTAKDLDQLDEHRVVR